MNCGRCLFFRLALLLVWFAGTVSAQDVLQHVTYVCNGQRLVIDNCNMRDTSDASKCMVGHPDTILSNGLMKYTTETRGDLKKLLPTCKQPSADEIAKAKAFDKKISDQQAAGQKKADDELKAKDDQWQALMKGNKKALTPEEQKMNRCITSGRLPATCTGNALLKSFEGMLTQVLPGTPGTNHAPGPYIGGNFVGGGGWRVEFDDQSAMQKCGGLDLDPHPYSLSTKNGKATITIDTTPKPLILDVRADGMLVGTGPVIVDGVVQVGSRAVKDPNSGGYKDSNGIHISDYEANNRKMAGEMVTKQEPTTTYQPVFAPKRASCSQAILTSKGAGASAVDIQTNFLKSMFNDGEKGPVAPAGLRMQGSYGGDGGILIEFYPESAVVSCGDAAHASPYVVQVTATGPIIKIEDAAKPITLTMKADGGLDSGSGLYEVHGRSITGQNDNGDFTFAPLNMTCNLTALKAGANPGAPPAGAAAASNVMPGGNVISTPNAPLGNAVLTIVSGFAAPNPLAGYPYTLLKDSFGNALAKGGVQVPAGTSAFKYFGMSCQNRTPDCQKISQIWKATAISAARADATGKVILPGVQPGTYYLMISVRYNNQPIFWDMKVDLKAGDNSVTLNPQNATVMK